MKQGAKETRRQGRERERERERNMMDRTRDYIIMYVHVKNVSFDHVCKRSLIRILN